MADIDALTAAREKVLNWGPDLRLPAQIERFRRDVAELERLAAHWATWNAGIEEPSYRDPGSIRVTDPGGRVGSFREVEVLGAVAAEVRIEPRPLPDHDGRMQSSDGGPWTCTDCGWAEGDVPREHDADEEPDLYEGDGSLCICGDPDTVHGDTSLKCMECGDTFQLAGGEPAS